MISTRSKWSREQLLVAFHLYCRMPFGKMHNRNPDIVHYAELIGRTPSALAMKLTNIASLDPAITETGRKGLEGASTADRAMWEEMQADWEHFAIKTQNAICQLDSDNNQQTYFDDEEIDDETDYESINKTIISKVRIGQAFFRRAVLSAYQYRCCITEMAISPLLVASHIVPWRADATNRLNPRNGLCLSMIHDKAFDIGIICVADDFTVRVSQKYKKVEDVFFAQPYWNMMASLFVYQKNFGQILSF